MGTVTCISTRFPDRARLGPENPVHRMLLHVRSVECILQSTEVDEQVWRSKLEEEMEALVIIYENFIAFDSSPIGSGNASP